MKPQSDEALPARSIGKQLFTKVLSVILIGLLVLDLYFNQTLFADVVPYVWTMAAVQLICHIANLFVLFLLLSATEMFQVRRRRYPRQLTPSPTYDRRRRRRQRTPLADAWLLPNHWAWLPPT